MNRGGQQRRLRETLNELNAILRDPNIEPTTRYMLVLSKAAIEQSRLTNEGRKSHERLVQNLVFATWALVIATPRRGHRRNLEVGGMCPLGHGGPNETQS
jgi:hypothetical protein